MACGQRNARRSVTSRMGRAHASSAAAPAGNRVWERRLKIIAEFAIITPVTFRGRQTIILRERKQASAAKTVPIYSSIEIRQAIGNLINDAGRHQRKGNYAPKSIVNQNGYWM